MKWSRASNRYIHVCMFMYVRTYVCMYVCMYTIACVCIMSNWHLVPMIVANQFCSAVLYLMFCSSGSAVGIGWGDTELSDDPQTSWAAQDLSGGGRTLGSESIRHWRSGVCVCACVCVYVCVCVTCFSIQLTSKSILGSAAKLVQRLSRKPWLLPVPASLHRRAHPERRQKWGSLLSPSLHILSSPHSPLWVLFYPSPAQGAPFQWASRGVSYIKGPRSKVWWSGESECMAVYCLVSIHVHVLWLHVCTVHVVGYTV